MESYTISLRLVSTVTSPDRPSSTQRTMPRTKDRARTGLDCVGMTARIRSLPPTTIALLAGSDDPDTMESYVRQWVAWVLDHCITHRWRSWQYCHKVYIYTLTPSHKENGHAPHPERQR